MKRDYIGGSRQRARQAESASSGVVAPRLVGAAVSSISKLAQQQLCRWSLGQSSAATVRDTVKAAVEDGARHPDLDRLCKIGAKAQRDLTRMLAPTPLTRCLTRNIYIPFKKHWSMINHGHEMRRQSMLLPHELFAAMYEHYPDQFHERFLGGDQTNLRRFWTSMAGNPQLEENAALKARPNYRSHCVPISLHGDGVPVVAVGKTWAKSADIYSMAGVLSRGSNFANATDQAKYDHVTDHMCDQCRSGCHQCRSGGVRSMQPKRSSPGSTMDFTYMIWGYFKRYAVKTGPHRTLSAFFKVLSWSLRSLWEGTWPHNDWEGRPLSGAAAARAGTPLANGYYAVLWTFRSDLEHSANNLGLAAHNSRPTLLLSLVGFGMRGAGPRAAALGRDTTDCNFCWLSDRDPLARLESLYGPPWRNPNVATSPIPAAYHGIAWYSLGKPWCIARYSMA